MPESAHAAVSLPSRDEPMRRQYRLVVGGQVQGVGFRPFVFRLARQHGLDGLVRNCLGEVEIIVSGTTTSVTAFQRDLIDRAPPLAEPFLHSVAEYNGKYSSGFHIVASEENAAARVFLPPDYFMCDECCEELRDPADRRYLYPFINCTQCGPRYTLIRKLPYDRCNTSMAEFPLCDACRAEDENPRDRRFHAEPVACPECG
ncbi:MAG: acylphosphatase, partial [Woeseiaceae bacterium]